MAFIAGLLLLLSFWIAVPRLGASEGHTEGATLSSLMAVSGRLKFSVRSGYIFPALGGETLTFFRELTPG